MHSRKDKGQKEATLIQIATFESETATDTGADAIRPFRVHFPDEALADLKRRVAATRWPERELVPDASQGVQLATMQNLARYWTSEYDWRKVEARLNALPQFMTNIDGLDIHFIHVRRNIRMRCHSSSRTGGPARSPSS
jgi:hypothetical protein